MSYASAQAKVEAWAKRFRKEIKIIKTFEIDEIWSQVLYQIVGGDYLLAEYDSDRNELSEICLETEMIEAIAGLYK